MFLSPESAWVMGPVWSTEHWGAETASRTQCAQQGGERAEWTLAGGEQVLCVFYGSRQLAAGKKMSSFSFSAIRLFQRKNKQQKQPLRLREGRILQFWKRSN